MSHLEEKLDELVANLDEKVLFEFMQKAEPRSFWASKPCVELGEMPAKWVTRFSAIQCQLFIEVENGACASTKDTLKSMFTLVCYELSVEMGFAFYATAYWMSRDLVLFRQKLIHDLNQERIGSCEPVVH